MRLTRSFGWVTKWNIAQPTSPRGPYLYPPTARTPFTLGGSSNCFYREDRKLEFLIVERRRS